MDKYKNGRFDYLETYLSVEKFIERIKEKEALAKTMGWIDLKVEIEQQDYSDSYGLYLVGKRLKTDQEVKEDLREEARREKYEMEQYKKLKAKYEKKE